jgi:hypothetical protein
LLYFPSSLCASTQAFICSGSEMFIVAILKSPLL